MFLCAWSWLNQTFQIYRVNIPSVCTPPTEGPFGWVVVAAYAPLLLTGPLLAVVTYAYYRRRTSRPA